MRFILRSNRMIDTFNDGAYICMFQGDIEIKAKTLEEAQVWYRNKVENEIKELFLSNDIILIKFFNYTSVYDGRDFIILSFNGEAFEYHVFPYSYIYLKGIEDFIENEIKNKYSDNYQEFKREEKFIIITENIKYLLDDNYRNELVLDISYNLDLMIRVDLPKYSTIQIISIDKYVASKIIGLRVQYARMILNEKKKRISEFNFIDYAIDGFQDDEKLLLELGDDK